MKACLFDIDGTLVATGGAGMHAFADVFREVFDVAELSRDVSFNGRSDRAIAAGFFEAHGLGDSDANWAVFREAYVDRLAERLPRSEGRMLPGVVELINAVEALGDVHIGLLTGNLRRAAEQKLSHFGLWERFAFGGFGDVHPDRNDIAATAAAEARRRHGAIAGEERIVVIGDTPNDVRCARSIGAFAVAVPTGFSTADELAACEPDLLLPTLEEGAAVVDFLAA